MDPSRLSPGEPVALVGDDGSVHLVRVPEDEETVRVEGLGVLSGKVFAEASLGQHLQLGRRGARVLPLTPPLVFQGLERRAQVITPQDAARIAYECAVGPGTTVVEGGLGSGALTSYLAYLVGETGRVHGYEVREDHLSVARANLERSGLSDRVEIHHGALEEAEEPCDAFLVDVPDPAGVVPAASRCLRPGGRVCFYTPLVDQMVSVRQALDEGPYTWVRSLEQLERGWTVHRRGARPDFEMLGHTGFLTLATRTDG